MTVWSKAGLEHVHPSIFLLLRLGGSALILQVMNIATYFYHQHKQQGKDGKVENRSTYAKLDEQSDSTFTQDAEPEVRLLPRGKEWGWLLLLSFFGICEMEWNSSFQVSSVLRDLTPWDYVTVLQRIQSLLILLLLFGQVRQPSC